MTLTLVTWRYNIYSDAHQMNDKFSQTHVGKLAQPTPSSTAKVKKYFVSTFIGQLAHDFILYLSFSNFIVLRKHDFMLTSCMVCFMFNATNQHDFQENTFFRQRLAPENFRLHFDNSGFQMQEKQSLKRTLYHV